MSRFFSRLLSLGVLVVSILFGMQAVFAQAPAGTNEASSASNRPGTCTMECVNGRRHVTARENNPDTIPNDAACATRCQEVCATKHATDGSAFRCESHSFQARSSDSTNAAQATQGGTSAAAPQALSANSSCPAFNGIHDPFCGKSLATIVGNIIKFLLGVAGALFLAMFVYGGAVWLTAGSSDRHEEARKTLINAATGVLVIIFSYTLVTGLIRLFNDLGVSQRQTQAQLDGATKAGTTATPSREQAVNQNNAGGGGSCNAQNFIQACHERCADSGLVQVAGRLNDCNQACDGYGPSICNVVRNPSDCTRGCDQVCNDAGWLEPLCDAECSGLCAAAFR